MLNRIYIVFGILLITVIAAAFLVPRFIDWSDRRVQLEALASEALGTDVTIGGKIGFELLPQPRLSFGAVEIGPKSKPLVKVAAVDANFSLMDFLRDRFVITKLSLKSPQLYLTVNADGQLTMPLALAATVGTSKVSIAGASFSNGTIRLSDARSGQSWQMTDMTGSLTLTALRGPFGLNAKGVYDGKPYQMRINTSPLNDTGGLQMAVFVRPEDGSFSLNAEGLLTTGISPGFTGKGNFHLAPRPGTDGVSGDLVIDAEIDANAERVRLSNYVLLPDENRAGTRLTGAAVVNLGAKPNFDVVISGGVVAMAPRDARTASNSDPYELVRFLDELPAAPVPPLPGRIGVDVSELDLRALSLRDVRIDATSDGTDWQIQTFMGKLTGDSSLKLSGHFGGKNDHASFDGTLAVETSRLDALAQLWRRPDARNPLFGVKAKLSTDVVLADGALTLRNGHANIAGGNIDFSGVVPKAGGVLALKVALGALNAAQSQILTLALPDISADPAFGSSFSGGTFDLSADSAVVMGLPGTKLAARGTWDAKGISFDQLAASQFGGASFTLSGAMARAGKRAVVTGGGRIILDASAKDGILPLAFAHLDIAPQVQGFIEKALPANLDITLAAPDKDGKQAFTADGGVGIAQMHFGVNLGQGLVGYLNAPLGLRLELTADNPAGLAAQLGVDVALPDTGRARVVTIAQGTPVNSMDVQATFDTDTDKLQFTGNMILADPATPKGRGKLEFDLPEPAVWGEWLGAGGIYLPHLKGLGELSFAGSDSVTLSAVNADADGTPVTGEIVRTVQSGAPLYSGQLMLGNFDIAALASVATGGPALLNLGGGVWPDGPIADISGGRPTRGRIGVTVGKVTGNGRVLASNAGFDFLWDATNTRFRGLNADMGGGKLTLETGFCCTGVAGAKQVTARLGLSDVKLDSLLPSVPRKLLGAQVSGSLEVNGTGTTLAEMLASLTGQGSFTASKLSIAGFDPSVFAVTAGTQNILDLDPASLTGIVSDALLKGPFTAPKMDGVLSVAGGILRASNLAADNAAARLFGGFAVNLSTLGLSGSWTLTPMGQIGDGQLINESTARVVSTLGGTLPAPERTFDLAQMVEAVKVRAYELEVARLEQLKAQDEARARAAAEERARLMATEARQKAEAAVAAAAADKAAADKAAADKAAADKAAADKAAADAAALKAHDAQANMSVQGLPADGAPVNLVPDAVSPNQPLDLTGGSAPPAN